MKQALTSLVLALMALGCGKKEAVDYRTIATPSPGSTEQQLPVQAACGWSTAHNEGDAALQALGSVQRTVPTPQFITMYATVDYDGAALLSHIASAIPPQTPLFGMTSCKGVVTSEGVHRSPHGAVALLGLSSPGLHIVVAGARHRGDEGGFDAGVAAALDSLAPFERKPDLILICVTPGLEERSLAAIRTRFGTSVPVFGGSAADNKIEGKWQVFCGREVFSKGIALAAFYSSAQIGHAYASGYLATSEQGVVTGVDNTSARTITHINNRPAAVVLNEMTKKISLNGSPIAPEGYFASEMRSGHSILMKAALTPLAKRLQVGDETHYVCGHPAAIDPKTLSLSLFTSFAPGDTVYLLQGQKDALLNRPEHVARSALISHNLRKQDIGAGFFIYCAGTMLAVEDSIDQSIVALNTVMQGVPFIGAFTFGEQGFIEGTGSHHANLMNSFVVLSTRQRQD
jgi:hypothetical protein